MKNGMGEDGYTFLQGEVKSKYYILLHLWQNNKLSKMQDVAVLSVKFYDLSRSSY